MRRIVFAAAQRSPKAQAGLLLEPCRGTAADRKPERSPARSGRYDPAAQGGAAGKSIVFHRMESEGEYPLPAERICWRGRGACSAASCGAGGWRTDAAAERDLPELQQGCSALAGNGEQARACRSDGGNAAKHMLPSALAEGMPVPFGLQKTRIKECKELEELLWHPYLLKRQGPMAFAL